MAFNHQEHSPSSKSGDCLIKTLFYSKNNKLRCARIQARLSHQEKTIRNAPVPSPYQQRLFDPVGHWRIFHRQKDAFDFARCNSEDLHVFAYESETFAEHQGQRLYLVASYEHFWHYYSQMSGPRRHHYEVIPHGSVCHLYFDLEFSLACNPTADGVTMTAVLIKYVCVWLRRLYRITCKPEHVLQLDASTPVKFSRHLVFHLPAAAFQTNIHAGGFVSHICNEIFRILHEPPLASDDTGPSDNTFRNKSAELSSEPPAKIPRTHSKASDHVGDTVNKTDSNTQEKTVDSSIHLDAKDLEELGLSKDDLTSLVVKNKSNNDVLFCDTGVYTKNRNFRLYLSCKMGKNNPLLVAKENKYRPRKLCHGRHLNTLAELRRDGDAEMFLDSLISNICFRPGLRILTFEGKTAPFSTVPVNTDLQRQEVLNSAELAGYQQSPYPEIDDYITSVLTWGGVQGTIRRWSYFCQGELLVYDISHNRWCHNIGRAHRSNNIMLVVDLKKGVYFQKCHDPVCRSANYRSQEWPLPQSVLPASFFEDPEEGELDDDELLDAVNVLERSVHDVDQTDSNNQDSDDIVNQGEQIRLNSPDTESDFDKQAVPELERQVLEKDQLSCKYVTVESSDEDIVGDDDLLEAVQELETSIIQ